MSKSEFGRGFVYNLVLFAKHWAMFRETMKETNMDMFHIWFNGASDHFYELEIPEQFKKTQIGKLAQELRDDCLSMGHGARMFGPNQATREDFIKTFEKLEKLCMLLDKELGVKAVKAEFN